MTAPDRAFLICTTAIHLSGTNFTMRFNIIATLIFTCTALVSADTVVLKNGDTLTGTIGQVTGKNMKFVSPVFGEISIPIENITTYKIDTPVRVQPKAAPSVVGPVTGDATTVKVADKNYRLDQLKSINPPAQAWTGNILANLSLARGNTNNFTVGSEALAALRRDDDENNDRITANAAYNFGDSGGGPGNAPRVTITDNWRARTQYDKFWNEQLYGFVVGKIEHDRIANLDYRVSPGLGIGYQWIETDKVKFSTEAGFNYIYESYGNGGSDDSISVRFAYHYDNKLSDDVSLFHNLEYVPAIDDPGDYNFTTDVGLRFKITGNIIGQFKAEYKRDSVPASGSLKNDLLYLVGFGWQF
jgi:hypothetical protein